MVDLLVLKEFDVHIELEYFEVLAPNEDLVRWIMEADLLQVLTKVPLEDTQSLLQAR